MKKKTRFFDENLALTAIFFILIISKAQSESLYPDGHFHGVSSSAAMWC